MIEHVIRTLTAIDEIGLILLAAPRGWKERAVELFSGQNQDRLKIIEGEATRQDTVYSALQSLPNETKMVVVHDGARPLVTPELVRAVIAGAKEHGACIPTLPCEETVKRVRGGHVVETLSRAEIHIVQTPQAFYYEVIVEAHNRARERKWRVTDDATLVERSGRPVATIPGDLANIKITRLSDIKFAEILSA
jgi:2-C-methyl-D-erythritol 4-phosphate cytidylyltransferase